jgi:hypothetical protein
MLDRVAQVTNTFNLRPGGYTGGIQNLTASQIVSGGLLLVLVIAALVFFFILVLGGIRWILSEGDKTKAESARGMITAALIGLVIVFAAWAITQLLEVFFGINFFGELVVPNVQEIT